MLDIKRCVIKIASNIKIIDSKKGKVTLENELILRGLRNNTKYEEVIKDVVCIMRGINKVEFSYERLNFSIFYDYRAISEKRVVTWIKSIIEIILNDYEEVKNLLEKNNKEVLKEFIFYKLKKEINLNKI